MKIPGLGRFKKKVSIILGTSKKNKFRKYIYSSPFSNKVQACIANKKQIKIELVTFTNSQGFDDFLLSVLSFISCIGLPSNWTIYADSEFTIDQKKILSEFNFLIIKDWFVNIIDTDKLLYSSHWQYRKYLSFASHKFSSTTIFLDSDIVFYKEFNKYIDFFKEGNWYMADPTEAFSIDAEIVENKHYKRNMYLINSGFMVFNDLPPWNLGKVYLEESRLKNFISHFTEQSAINIMFVNDINAKILEPRRFIVSANDHFKIGYLKTDHLAIRHYVGPIRHKMWQAGWKQFL